MKSPVTTEAEDEAAVVVEDAVLVQVEETELLLVSLSITAESKNMDPSL